MNDRFLLFAPQDSGNLAGELGRADYSYWFVLDYYRPMLETLGEVLVLDRPDEQVPPAAGVRDIRMLFMPPQTIPLELAPHAIPVFAWEYTTIPTESWGGDVRNDWREVLRRAPGAITHSTFAQSAVRSAMGMDYLIAALPAPVWDRYAPLANQPAGTSLQVDGVVLDSQELGLATALNPPLPDVPAGPRTITLTGLVHTMIVNPDDGRKVWDDAVTAFVAAHGDDPDLTLVIKLVHFDRDRVLGLAWDLIRRLAPFRCRIILIHAYLPRTDFQGLVTASHFAVNSSRGEGQCLPLMEFMSAGVPAIAPDHTAMADYVRDDDAFVVASGVEWTHWPHDSRRFLRCLMHPVEWASLRDAFRTAAQVVREDPQQYSAMRAAATQRLHDFCAIDVISAGMREFLARLARP